MLLFGIEPLQAARREHRAIPGFVAYNLETAQAIVQAGERTGKPLLILAGSSAFRHTGLHELASMCVDLASRSSALIGVHLDHCRSLDEIEACLEHGYTSVMIDGSHLPYEENVDVTRSAVALAHARGAWVEAELVGTAGDEDVSGNATATAMTDPDVARDFIAQTGIDALAVAVGNVHGFTDVEPQIDLARLEAIREATDIPLVLHGASGLSQETLLDCVRRGVAKINVNTELRRAYLDAFAEALPASVQKVDLATPLAAARSAVADAACAIVTTLEGAAAPAGASGD
jgi:tagatose 1,6-diphosphate aldolase GatY/KbaY